MPYKKLPPFSEELRRQKRRWRVETMEDLAEGQKNKLESIERLIKEFWNMVNVGKRDECWLWIGSVPEGKYGIIYFNRINHHAHRMSFLIYNLRIDPDLVVMHSCDYPPCVNPHHLKQSTQGENVRDSSLKGRINRKLTWSQVSDIRRRRINGDLVPRLSSDYVVSTNAICKIINRKTWTHVH